MFHTPSLSPAQVPQIPSPTVDPAVLSASADEDADYFAYKQQYPSYAALYAPTADAPGPLRLRASPELSLAADAPAACVSTQQVFDLAGSDACATPEPNVPSEFSPQVPASTGALRASSPATAKKARVIGERITTKDFVPPDVSGLSKREARLVKNR
jgi:hypothetical protein